MSYGPTFAAAVDVTGGTLDLPVGARGIENLRLVDLVDSGVVLAEALDLPVTGGFRRGSCWGLLAPSAHGWVVVLMGTTPADLAGEGIEIGRLSDDDAHRWASRFAGRPLRVAIVIEGTPGFDRVDVRFRSDLLARPVLAPPPAVPAPAAPGFPPPPVASSTLPPPPTPQPPAPPAPVAPAPVAPAPVAEAPQTTSYDEAASWPPPVVPAPPTDREEPVAPTVEPDLPAAHGLPDADQPIDAVVGLEPVAVPYVDATTHETSSPDGEPASPGEPLATTSLGEGEGEDGGAEPEAWAPSPTQPETDVHATAPEVGADHVAETPWSIDVRDATAEAAPWAVVAESVSAYEAAVEAGPETVTAPMDALGGVESAVEAVSVPEPEPEPGRAPVTEADLEAVPAPPAPPGWYPDPGDARFWRRWDGTQWTDEASVQPPGLAAS